MEIVINPPPSPIFLHFLGLDLRYYGIILTLAIIIGIALAYFIFLKKKSKNEADFFMDYAPILVLFSIIGARIFYVTGNIKFYIQHPIEIFFINHGGISIWGAIIFAIVGLVYYLKKEKKNILVHLDVISCVMPLCQAIGRFGNYFNQEAFGKPTNFFIKMYVSKAYRPEKYSEFDYFHPAFLYESILDLVIFIVLISLIKNKKNKDGTVFCVYIILYSIVRLIVESIRTDSVVYIFNFPVASLISMAMLVLSIALFKKIHKK